LPDSSQRRTFKDQSHPSGMRETDPSGSVGDLTKFLGQHGAGASSADLALDLLLNEIVAQACLATSATGAAIALARDGDFVCRATSGYTAPDLGSHLSSSSGLSAACIRSHEVQHCEDTETDARVDAAACRRLGVRSVLVVPLLAGSEVAGVFEIFSPKARVFGDRETQTVLALSHRIVNTLASQVSAEAVRTEASSTRTLLENASPAPLKVEEFPALTPSNSVSDTENPAPGKDYWTSGLTVLVIGLSLLLGWMLGRVGWKRDVKTESARSVSLTAKPDTVPATETSAGSVQQGGNQPVSSVNNSTANRKSATPGGLVVYEDGKLVFQMKALPEQAHSGVSLAASQSDARPASAPVKIPPTAAESFVIQRVEPQYPEAARQERVQGAVVLQVEVNKNGVVQELRALSGDPILIMAAADAVRHWRFKPYAPRGQALDFETQITVNFRLP
jgi:TonB family protein